MELPISSEVYFSDSELELENNEIMKTVKKKIAKNVSPRLILHLLLSNHIYVIRARDTMVFLDLSNILPLCFTKENTYDSAHL